MLVTLKSHRAAFFCDNWLHDHKRGKKDQAWQLQRLQCPLSQAKGQGQEGGQAVVPAILSSR